MTKMISEDAATGKVAEIYDEIRSALGLVPNLFKAQAAIDEDWLELNRRREQLIMLSNGALNRKTKELVAMVVCLASRSTYCALAHETLARIVGASDKEVAEAKQVVELFESFGVIAETLKVPVDVTPDMLEKSSRCP